jgi:hypothetical protein
MEVIGWGIFVWDIPSQSYNHVWESSVMSSPSQTPYPFEDQILMKMPELVHYAYTS